MKVWLESQRGRLTWINYHKHSMASGGDIIYARIYARTLDIKIKIIEEQVHASG